MSAVETLNITLVTGYTSDNKDRLIMSKKVVENVCMNNLRWLIY